MPPTLAPRAPSRSPGTSPPSRAASSRGTSFEDAPSRPAPPTVLLVHNFYQKPGGGRTACSSARGALLRDKGHRVLEYTLSNDDVDGMGRLALLRRTVWSDESYRAVRAVVEDEGVDVVHVHNTLPLAVAVRVPRRPRRRGPPRSTRCTTTGWCARANLLFRDGAPCTDCVGTSLSLPGVRHGCYRGSRAATAAVAGDGRVPPPDRDVGPGRGPVRRAEPLRARPVRRGRAPRRPRRGQAQHAGGPRRARRRAATSSCSPGGWPGARGSTCSCGPGPGTPRCPPLRICGDGPLADAVAAATRADGRIDWLGWQTAGDVDRLMGEAAALVVPSKWYEGWPLVIVEAMGRGTPVVATDHGVFPEMIEDGVTGRLFALADSDALSAAVHRVCDEQGAMREATWALFEREYSRDVNYDQLVGIYRDALATAAAAGVRTPRPRGRARPRRRAVLEGGSWWSVGGRGCGGTECGSGGEGRVLEVGPRPRGRAAPSRSDDECECERLLRIGAVRSDRPLEGAPAKPVRVFVRPRGRGLSSSEEVKTSTVSGTRSLDYRATTALPRGRPVADTRPLPSGRGGPNGAPTQQSGMRQEHPFPPHPHTPPSHTPPPPRGRYRSNATWKASSRYP